MFPLGKTALATRAVSSGTNRLWMHRHGCVLQKAVGLPLGEYAASLMHKPIVSLQDLTLRVDDVSSIRSITASVSWAHLSQENCLACSRPLWRKAFRKCISCSNCCILSAMSSE